MNVSVLKCILFSLTYSAYCLFFFTMRISENVIDFNVSVDVTKSPSGTSPGNTKNPDLQSVSVCVSMCLSISSWGRCDMKIWICIWVSSWTLGSLPWQWNTALEEVWPTCWPMVTWGWTGCSSRRCSWTWLRYRWDNVYIYMVIFNINNLRKQIARSVKSHQFHVHLLWSQHLPATGENCWSGSGIDVCMALCS